MYAVFESSSLPATSNAVRLVIGVIVLSCAISAVQMPALDTVGPRVGATAPDFSGIDQFGRTQTLKSVMGPDGVMLVFYRSADW